MFLYAQLSLLMFPVAMFFATSAALLPAVLARSTPASAALSKPGFAA